MEDEQILIKKAQKGEAEAFGELYDQYLPKIYRFVRVKVSQREEAEDLTHQAFLNAWKNIGQYSPQGHTFGTWLYRIARNVVTDHYRRTSTAQEIELKETILPAQIKIDTNPAPDELLDEHIRQDRIFRAIRHLKEGEQDVLIMRFIEDMSIKEVAEVLGKTESAVKVMQHRALKKAREALEREQKEQ